MTDESNKHDDTGSFELTEETAKRAGRPPGAVGKKLGLDEFEKLLKGNTKEAIIRLVGLMRSDNDDMSYKACCKILDYGSKMFKEDKDMRKLQAEMAEELKKQEAKKKEQPLAEVKTFKKLEL